MGCISAKVTRVSESCDLNITKAGRLRVVISNVFTLVTAAITFVSTMIVNITRTPSQVAVNVSPKERPVVNVGLVCTVAISDGVEMWWCDGWKALWDNRKRILWQQE